MSKNLLSATANALFDQIKKLQSTSDKSLDAEVKRLDSMSKGAEAISELADKEIKVLYATGFLPDGSIIVDKDEVKLVNAKRSLNKTQTGAKGFIDEFAKQ